MSDVRREQVNDSKQSQIEANDMLVVSGLSVRSQNKTILEDVSFKAKRGTSLAIVGPNGGGKTTLFKALLNIIPYNGMIWWNKEVRLSYVPQSLVSTDLPISVEEFLRFKCRTDFETCINSVGLEKPILRQRLGSLSGGELQRVLIAWAIVDNPSVLLFDEPTSGIDIGAEEPIYDKVNHLKKEVGITILLISHNMHVVMHYSDYVLALNKHVLFFGDVKSLTHSQLLSIIYGSEFVLSEEEQYKEHYSLSDTITLTLGLVVGAFVGSTAGYLGSIMVSKHMALVGDALSHVALPGLALGILFNFNPFIGAFALLVITVIVTWYLQKSTTLSVEAIIGLLFVLALAIGILITPRVDLLEALFGDVSKITLTDTIITVVVSVCVIFVTRTIYGKLIVSMISKELAIASRIKVERINLIYLFLVATIVAVGIKEVGTLLVGAVVIVPAAAAKNISSTLSEYSIMSGIFGLASATSGVILSSYVNVPAGPLVVIVGTAIFVAGLVVSLLFKRLRTRTASETQIH